MFYFSIFLLFNKKHIFQVFKSNTSKILINAFVKKEIMFVNYTTCVFTLFVEV